MATTPEKLTRKERERFASCPVRCPLTNERITSLPDYLAVLSSLLSDDDGFWFRGHRDLLWQLVPSALRYDSVEKRNAAIDLLRDFRRVAEIKLDRLPNPGDHLRWLQLAQHYGIPTRLLDWTESATMALYFACVRPEDPETEGVVFVLNPQHLSRLKGRRDKTSLDAHLDQSLVEVYFELDGTPHPRAGLPTIAINPVWNSERLMLQRGVFTLHGSRRFQLDETQAPSLVGIPILREAKARLRRELGRIGVDEMTVFPELEHACSHLRRFAGLDVS